MQRPGADTSDMKVSDFLCDFSGRPWDGAFPLVEGHQGSLISGDSLTLAYLEVVVAGGNSAPEGYQCRMCLEHRDDPAWESPVTGACICKRCIKQAAGGLHKDPDWDWRKPEASDQA